MHVTTYGAVSYKFAKEVFSLGVKFGLKFLISGNLIGVLQTSNLIGLLYKSTAYRYDSRDACQGSEFVCC